MHDPEIEIVAAVNYGDDLEPALRSNTPVHLLFLDIHVPNSALDIERYPILHVIPKLLKRYAELRIVVVSVYKQATLIKAIMDAGASGYILKDDRNIQQNLSSVIRTITAGGIYMSKDAYEQFVRKSGKDPELSPRQAEILYLCASHSGWSSAKLGEALGLSAATIRNLLSQIYAKFGVSTRTAAIERAREMGLIPPVDVLDS
ncbi:MAG: response regulator transcription factor, partial [Caldilineaceae bacterium]|nr:response regulator transcription factor [Caldilineaceae bacterium]